MADTTDLNRFEDLTIRMRASFGSYYPYVPKGHGKCPHCGQGVEFLEPPSETFTWMGHLSADPYPRSGRRPEESLGIVSASCPLCYSLIVSMNSTIRAQPWLLWPRAILRNPLPGDVPEEIARDYQEAAAVLAISARASAALSRRCLQSALRSEGKVKKGGLSDEVNEAIQSLPVDIGKDLHVLRELGNFGAHATRSVHTGEIVDVEVGEAEWMLDVLDKLFDYYYEKPKVDKARLDALNEKLKAAGRDPLPEHDSDLDED